MKEITEEKKNKKHFTIVVSILTGLLALAVGIISGYFIYAGTRGLSDDEQKIINTYRILKNEWLYGNEDEYLADQGVAGLASGIASSEKDNYTFYTSTTEAQGLSTDGKGLGFSSHYYDGGLYVTDVHNGPNSDKLKIGDVLYGVTINDSYYDFQTHTYSEIHNYLNSITDTTTIFNFKVVRSETTINLALTRSSYNVILAESIAIPSSTNNYTLGIKVNSYLDGAAAAVKGIINNYVSKGTVNKLIIDLRGNGGGLVSQASEMAKLFVKKGTFIYSLINKDGKTLDKDSQTKDPTFSIPSYSVIIDGSSASASEIFTLAMRAGTDCVVYGQTSYGKGIAQNLITFSDGSVLRYTYAYVYGPERDTETMYDEGNDDDKIMSIHGKGIIPDISFDTPYVYLNTAYDYTQYLGVSDTAMNYLLTLMNQLYPDKGYPDSYSSSYRFTDAVSNMASLVNEKYALSIAPFDDTGKVSKSCNDKIVKEAYDGYLKIFAELTNEVVGNN
ncbi:MAG: S41 family peptidase [Bacilli bacterium]|jgi:carboxyl-terminal processing protease